MVLNIKSVTDFKEMSYGVPESEHEILKYLIDARVSLSQLKTNRSKYLNSKEVRLIHQEVLTKVRELDDIRRAQLIEKNKNDSDGGEVDEKNITTLLYNLSLHNKVDSLVDDVFQLLSLCFLTVGLKNSAPATYASLSTVQKLLEHLNESNIFTNHDLRPIKERLDEISTIVQNNSYKNYEFNTDEEGMNANQVDDEEIKQNLIEEDLLLRAKLKYCNDEYRKIHAKLEEIHPDLVNIMEKLYHIRRNLLSLASPTHKIDTTENISIFNENKYSRDMLNKLKAELEELETHRDEDGNFKSLETNKVELRGQNALASLVDNCHDLINDFTNSSGDNVILDVKLQPIYNELIKIKTNLANLMITRRWTLRETDLFQYQKRLKAIDDLRVNGKFPSEAGNTKGQSILLYLLRRCYAIIYKLLESSEPVSESLQPIHNQLSTTRRCLLALKRMGGINNERELYPYQLKLASLDEQRIDGKFYDSNNEIPEGQGTLNALLAECFDILHELEIEAEERSTENPDSTTQEEDDDEDNEAYRDVCEDDQPQARDLRTSNIEYDNNENDDDDVSSYQESVTDTESRA